MHYIDRQSDFDGIRPVKRGKNGPLYSREDALNLIVNQVIIEKLTEEILR